MSDSFDRLTYLGKAATDILLVRNPVGTSMGVLAGILIHGVATAMAPFSGFFQEIKAAGVGMVHYVAAGIFGFNVRTWLRRDDIDPKVREALAFVEDQVRQGRLTRIQAKIHFNEIITRLVENVRMDPQTSDQIRRLSD